MTAVCQGSCVGIAVYDALSNEVSVLQSNDEVKGPLAWQFLNLVKLQVNPSVIYVSSTSDESFLKACRQHPSAAAAAGGENGCEVRMERSSVFSYAKAMARLETLKVSTLPAPASKREGLTALSSLVNLSRQQQVAALGALLFVMHKEQALHHEMGHRQRRRAAGRGQRRDEGRDTGGDWSEDGDQDGDRTMQGGGWRGGGGEGGEADGEVGTLTIASLKELLLEGFLQVDPSSMQSLSIFTDELHPSAMGLGKCKEGFSLFGMMATCATPMGKRLMRLWFLRPMVNLEVLEGRQDVVALLVRRPENAAALLAILRKIQDVPRLLQRLQQCQSRPDLKSFQALMQSLSQLFLLRDGFLQLAPELEDPEYDQSASSDVEPGPSWARTGIAHRLLAHVTSALSDCYSLIADVIDPDQADDGMMVAAGVCDELDALKDRYAGLPQMLTQVGGPTGKGQTATNITPTSHTSARCEAKSSPFVHRWRGGGRWLAPSLIASPPELARTNTRPLWAVVYIPQVGYVMQISGGQLTADLLDALPDYERAFEGDSEVGHSIYYRCTSTHQLDETFGDMLYQIQDLEATVCLELSKRLLDHSSCFTAAAAAVAELDCLIAFAAAAREHGFCRPKLTQDSVLHITQGRHPLTEQLVETFIPNDTHMGQSEARVQVITGPNASGKSCYAKQVALIVFMAHLGSFVPAQEATVGLITRIFTRLMSKESAALPLSGFMLDLCQVSSMLNTATGRSLILMDEFGKGTLASDGVGLVAAILTSFASRAEPPMVLACTHFHEVFDEAVLPKHPQLVFHTMEVMLDETNIITPDAAPTNPAAREHQGQPLNQLQGRRVFLYRLCPGKVAPTFGLYCARSCGIPAGVIRRAQLTSFVKLKLETISQKTREIDDMAKEDEEVSVV
ncbi:MAG: hypothetical protein WDW38_008911 [Sanguina aurantia]